MKWNPYLTFNGTCRAAFEFYEECLGGKIVAMIPMGETPMSGEAPAEMKDQIVHARLVVGDNVLMGSDCCGQPYEPIKGSSVSIQVDTPEEADRLYAALSAGGTVMMPIQETFWARRFGMFTDRFGVPWMINCEKPH